MRLYVGTGPTCGNPINAEKGNPLDIVIGVTTQTIDLPTLKLASGVGGKRRGAEDPGATPVLVGRRSRRS